MDAQLWSRCQELLTTALCHKFKTQLVNEWSLCFVIAAPHFLYAFVWLRPNLWQKAFRRSAVDVFTYVSIALKGIQLSAIALYLGSHRDDGLCIDLNFTLFQWLSCVLCVGMGINLNANVFKAIGVAGVYYGSKLGVKVEWYEGYPFNVLRHPQYWGSILILWGVYLFLWTQAQSEGLLAVCLLWSALYVLTAVWEDNL